MRENLRLIRPYIVLLLLFAIGRWIMGVRGVPYEKGHHVLSLVTLTWMAAAFYGAFTRKWRGFTVVRAAGLGATIGLLAGVVIFIATALTYAVGADTYFNHPRAVLGAMAATTERIGVGEALRSRAGGVVGNTLIAAILGALGWFLGGVLPDRTAAVPEKRAA